jgi:hypothetical protein
MSKVSLRRLLSQLTALALSTSAIAPVSAAPAPTAMRRAESDVESDLEADLEADHEIDREHIDEYDAALALGRSLALALGEVRPLVATQIAASWSLSADPVRRLAVALALEWMFPLVGDALVIDHLSRDRDPAIRIAAARAAWIRRPSGGDLGVLARLVDDPDPHVRAVAAAAR